MNVFVCKKAVAMYIATFFIDLTFTSNTTGRKALISMCEIDMQTLNTHKSIRCGVKFTLRPSNGLKMENFFIKRFRSQQATL